jgi:hypothetical protein
MKVFMKQPRDHLDYEIDLTEWLGENDHIQNVVVDAPDGIEITSVGYSDTRAVIWIKGGTGGVEYKLSPLIYTNNLVKEVDLLFIVEDF